MSNQSESTTTVPELGCDALLSARIAQASIALLHVVRRASELEAQGRLNKYQSIHAHLAANAIEAIGKHSISDNVQDDSRDLSR